MTLINMPETSYQQQCTIHEGMITGRIQYLYKACHVYLWKSHLS